MKSRKRHELQVKDRDLKIKAEVGACVRHFTANLVVRMSSFLHTASGVDILWLKNLRLIRRILFDESVNYIGRYATPSHLPSVFGSKYPRKFNGQSLQILEGRIIALPKPLCRKEMVLEPAILPWLFY